jgi:hypothetical protein
MFASIPQLSFQKSTRRDDLLSLAYMLLFLVCNESIPFLEQFYNDDPSQCDTPMENLEKMLKFKNKYSI